MKKILSVILISVLALSMAADIVKEGACSRPSASLDDCMKATSAYSNYSNSSCNGPCAAKSIRKGSKLEMATGLIIVTAIYTILGLSVRG
ncbi:MAG: hypothetical protein PHW02_04910 [bacterium]|nr:hypothetical protein [bacterium]